MRTAKAFTLIELIVVLFVIVLLAAMLVPYMGGAKEQVYCTQCQRNLQQIGVALSAQAAKASIQTGAMPKLMTGLGWYGAALVEGSRDILECPKGGFRVSGGASPFGWVTPIDPPPSARFDEKLEHGKEIRFWKEREAFTLPKAVTVDIAQPGYYAKGSDWKDHRSQLAAGTVVDIWFCHYDAVGSTNSKSDGGVTFEYEVLGMCVEDDTLDATDSACGYPGTVYHTGRNARGFEDNGAEKVTFEADRKTLTINQFQITSPGEEIRFFVSTPGASTGRALRCSYGMNNIVRADLTCRKQVMIVEYDKLLADVDGEGQDHDLAEHLQGRHFNKVNTLFVDGSVRLMPWDDLKTDANEPTRMWQP